MKNRLVPIAILLACVLGLSSCGSDANTETSAPEDPAFAEPNGSTIDLIDAAPDVDLSPEEVDLVQFEADWVCELQRRTFASEAAIDQALDQNLAGLGIDRADYDEFRSEVNESLDLRESILFSYQENCRP